MVVQTQDRDPVCGMRLESYDQPLAREYGGRTYVFCSSVCRERFDRNPTRYVPAEPAASLRLHVAGLSCAGEATRLEHRLARVAGVRQVAVNPVTETAYVTFDPDRLSLSDLQAAAAAAGFALAE